MRLRYFDFELRASLLQSPDHMQHSMLAVWLLQVLRAWQLVIAKQDRPDRRQLKILKSEREKSLGRKFVEMDVDDIFGVFEDSPKGEREKDRSEERVEENK